MLPRPVAGGYASSGLLAWFALSKYVDHMPLFRLQKQSERWGVRLPRQTMADWIKITSERLEPIYKQMHKELLLGDYLQCDETPIRFNDPDEKNTGTSEGWFLAVARPASDVIFDWRLSRRHAELTSLVSGFSGVLQSDGYQAYDPHAPVHPKVTWVCCWAHACESFFEAQGEKPKAVRVVLRLIPRMYLAEREWDEAKVTDTQRTVLRSILKERLSGLKQVTMCLVTGRSLMIICITDVLGWILILSKIQSDHLLKVKRTDFLLVTLKLAKEPLLYTRWSSLAEGMV